MIPFDLSPQVRGLVKHGIEQLVDMLDRPEPLPSMKRLFPPAYADAAGDNAAFEAEYQRLMGDDLRRRHREAAEAVLASIDASALSPDEAESWMRALNELRLVIGTMLDVSEDGDGPDDPEDPQMAAWVLYDVLGQIQSYLVDALAALL